MTISRLETILAGVVVVLTGSIVAQVSAQTTTAAAIVEVSRP
jgi:hypothetical protein